jgi:hypothetical protein
MPTQGTRYARLASSGPFNVPPGGPPAYPLPGTVTELRIPIPPGATTVAFCWEFFNVEGYGAFLNDGMAVAVVGPAGNLVQLLAYADAHSFPGACSDLALGFSIEVAPSGNQGFSGPLPALSGGEYLSVACWNGVDNAGPSHASIDDVRFTPGPAPCPPPPPPPPNDDCAGAIPIVQGVNGPFSNDGATTGPDAASCAQSADVADVWFSFMPVCPGAYRIDTCGAGFNTVLSVLEGCGSGIEIACSDDLPAGVCPSTLSSGVLLVAAPGTSYLVRVGGSVLGGAATGPFTLNVAPLMTLEFTTGPGFGTIGYVVRGGPPGGLYFAAITLWQGSFPAGSFFGIDIALAELAAEFNFGYPFTGALNACGAASFGPVSGAPSGLQVFGTVLGFPGPTYGVPSQVAIVPATATVP